MMGDLLPAGVRSGSICNELSIMSRGKLGKATHCPWCGTATLVRDTFSADTQSEHTHVSYICTTCCVGFSVRNSPRAMFVNHMYAIERAKRPPEERIRQQLKGNGGAAPLMVRPTEELKRVEGLLAAKKPHTKASREHIEKSLQAVRNELARRALPTANQEREQLCKQESLSPAPADSSAII